MQFRIHHTFPLSIILILQLLGAAACKESPEIDRFQRARRLMVENQIAARGIGDSNVLKAMRKVPRHLFVPANYRRFAYVDRPLPIGGNQTISQPYIVALMTELAAIDSSSRVLEIGTGSGYQAAILAEICDTVYTVEINAKLSNRAKSILHRLGYRNIRLKIGDGYRGWNEHAPYDAIIVTCAPATLPNPLVRQLKNNGRLVIPVGPTLSQNLIVYRKVSGHLKAEKIIPVRFVPMIDATGKSY